MGRGAGGLSVGKNTSNLDCQGLGISNRKISPAEQDLPFATVLLQSCAECAVAFGPVWTRVGFICGCGGNIKHYGDVVHSLFVYGNTAEKFCVSSVARRFVARNPCSGSTGFVGFGWTQREGRGARGAGWSHGTTLVCDLWSQAGADPTANPITLEATSL